MADFQKLLANKTLSAQEAVRLVYDNDNIIVPTGVGEPPALLTALSDVRHKYMGVKVWQLLAIRPYEYLDPETTQHVRHVSFFTSGTIRKGVNDGWIDLLPCHFSDIPRMIRNEDIPCDIVFAIASPMDEHGNFSLSLGTDYTHAAIEKCKRVVLEVNENVPYTFGNCHVHITEVLAVVNNNSPISNMASGDITEVETSIAKNVASLVKDGDTLQVGFGSLPDAIVNQLTAKKDLGIHTEVLSDGIISLLESGSITNAKKNVHPGKIVATFALGTQKLYQAMHNNPILEMYPAEYVNDPYVASENDNLVAINGIMQVDFTGQCAAETIGTYLYSSTGGQTDFVRAANMSKGGRAIMVLPATAKNGTVSRIAPVLTLGAHVSTHKNDVDYVVTEFGVAKLRGKTLRERAKNLINIAHPDFKEELIEQARQRNLWTEETAKAACV